ncbi:uncharacterized protein LOC131610872 [Vicia villosa]|uniref:uncharacterized protein LOC131610872 n=1 Tax=Vicia villosa TaxID=3911 RepID=UPI00273C076F|nr:uncharacterized protein LOC131610872 [Vicia villosa]
MLMNFYEVLEVLITKGVGGIDRRSIKGGTFSLCSLRFRATSRDRWSIVVHFLNWIVLMKFRLVRNLNMVVVARLIKEQHGLENNIGKFDSIDRIVAEMKG